MSDDTLDGTAAELRKAFDDAFARPVADDDDHVEDILALRIGERLAAVRVDQIAGIMRTPALTPVPGRNPALVGLAGIRGALVAVYDLSVLLGQSGPAGHSEGATGRGWTVVCASDPSAALRFDELLSYARVGTADFRDAGSRGEGRQFVEIDGENHRLVDVPALVQNLKTA